MQQALTRLKQHQLWKDIMSLYEKNSYPTIDYNDPLQKNEKANPYFNICFNIGKGKDWFVVEALSHYFIKREFKTYQSFIEYVK